jgi:hypothetical protein
MPRNALEGPWCVLPADGACRNRALEGRPKAALAPEGGCTSWFEVFAVVIIGLTITGLLVLVDLWLIEIVALPYEVP